jgi:hypothetical protein
LDYHIFGPLKEALHGQRFTSDYEVKDAVHTWLQSHLEAFFTDGIKRLINCYPVCVEKKG